MIALRRRILLALTSVIPVGLIRKRTPAEVITNNPAAVNRVQANLFELLDSRDKVRARLGFTTEEEQKFTYLYLIDKNDKVRLEFVVSPDEKDAEIRFKNSRQETVRTITTSQDPAIRRLPDQGVKADAATDTSIRNLQSQIDTLWIAVGTLIERVNRL